MIKELRIKNFKLIQDIHLEFSNKLNIIIGESGSGKSIILDAIKLISGNKVLSSDIRKGEETAEIECIIELKNPIDDYEELHIKRVFNRKNKNKILLNNKKINIADLKSIINKVIKQNSQNEIIELYNQEYRLKFFSTDQEYTETYQSLIRKEKELLELQNSKIDIDYVNYQLDQIKDLNITEDDFEIEDQIEDLNKQLEIAKNSQLIYNLSYEEHGLISILDQLGNLINNKEFNNIKVQLEKFIDQYVDIEIDEEELNILLMRKERLDSIKNKFKMNLRELIGKQKELEELLEKENNKDFLIQELSKNIIVIRKKVLELGKKLSKKREKEAISISNRITKELKELLMQHAEFKIELQEKEPSINGLDFIVFKIKSNKGEDFLPIETAASGGELSRVLLAIYSILADGVLIFDEIDNGTSGKVGFAIGKKLKSLSLNNQIICITHLPQVACYGDNVILINKENRQNRVISTASKLKDINDILNTLIGTSNQELIDNIKKMIK